MEKGILIKNGIIIGAILSIVCLSQQAYFKEKGGVLYAKASKKSDEYWLKAKNFFDVTIYPKAAALGLTERINGEVAKRGEAVKEEASKQKDGVVQHLWETIKNYFAAQFSKYSGTEVK